MLRVKSKTWPNSFTQHAEGNNFMIREIIEASSTGHFRSRVCAFAEKQSFIKIAIC